MAKVDTQSIPSELLDGYRAALGEERPDTGVRKRYPYRVPSMQTKAGNPSPKQKAERTRFLTAKENFAGVAFPTRQRWYAAAPPTSSFLWYYNFFIMSSLLGNANVTQGGAGLIKSIQHEFGLMATTGGKTFAINAVDPAKTVVMIQGSSWIRRPGEVEVFGVPIYPYIVHVQAAEIKLDWSIQPHEAGNVSIDVIEYI